MAEIADLPIEHGGSFHSYVNVYRVNFREGCSISQDTQSIHGLGKSMQQDWTYGVKYTCSTHVHRSIEGLGPSDRSTGSRLLTVTLAWLEGCVSYQVLQLIGEITDSKFITKNHSVQIMSKYTYKYNVQTYVKKIVLERILIHVLSMPLIFAIATWASQDSDHSHPTSGHCPAFNARPAVVFIPRKRVGNRFFTSLFSSSNFEQNGSAAGRQPEILLVFS